MGFIMRIIISPAKKMRVDLESMAPLGLPVFLQESQELLAVLKSKNYEELQKLWSCNAEIATWNYERLQNMQLERQVTAAIEAYDGIQYKYMAPGVFENGEFAYVQEHLRILSGFYGVVKPLDGVVPYRLEMQAKLKIDKAKDLYDFWQDKLYQEVRDASGIIINLASKEYSKCIEKYLTPKDIYITCTFGELKDNKVIQKGTYAKMARGEMVRYMAERNITEPEMLKGFDYLNYKYHEELSSDIEFVFIREV